jgi:predicted Zn-dependent protease
VKRKIALTSIIAMAAAAVFLGERLDRPVAPSPEPLLYLVADAERDLMRVPVSLSPLSDAQETAIGDNLAKNYLIANGAANSAGGREEELIAQYVSATGATLAKSAHRKLKYQFHYVPQEFLVNAFALPGGHIFIGKGLLELMDTEDELASVLGHEMEHVELRHCADREQIEARLRGFPLGELFEIPAEIFQAGYSKEQELEADREGVRLAVAGGYSAAGAVAMFRRFEKIESESGNVEKQRRRRSVLELPADIASVVVLDSLEGYFRSHPPARERRERIERLIAEERWNPGTQRPLAVAYMLRRDRARRLLAMGRTDEAREVAEEALALNPKYPPAINLVGDMDFERADFAQAAQLYRKSLDIEPGQAEVPTSYAVALAASRSARDASEQYGEWLRTLMPEAVPDSARAEDAGLKLLAGDRSPAKNLASSASSASDEKPFSEARLGWWYARAGDQQTAAELIGAALELRPQNALMANMLAWVLVAQQKYRSAEMAIVRVAGSEAAEASMLRAVIGWETKERPELAARNYAIAAAARKAWANPRWVTGLYGAKVEATVAAIRAENDRLTRATQSR